MTPLATAFASGVVFAIGLGVSGMTRPAKILAFLDLAGRWDPTLAFVMLGAVAVHAVLFRLIMRRRSPLGAERFLIPAGTPVDGRLLIGAALFGVGWGLAGYCPGPAIVSLASGTATPLMFVTAMLLGMKLAAVAKRRRGAGATPVRAYGLSSPDP